MSKGKKTVRAGLNFDTRWTYPPAPESTGHAQVEKRYGLFIGGRFVAPASGRYFDTINPATEQKICSVAEAGAVDVDRAVKAARQAYRKAWSTLPAAERGK